jgi:Ca-activated chloride channel family protein
VRVALKGKAIANQQRPVSNLVFLLDVSGSMNEPNKLPLVKSSLKLLVDQLDGRDHVAIAVYAGSSGLVLPPTAASDKQAILDALDRLDAGGSTNGAAGINLAYATAKRNFVKGGINRVIIATDGDFNVGTTSQGDLLRLIEKEAKSGVFLSVFGFGMGNLKDSTLEKLADKGNGNYGYIDSLAEARKALVEEAGGTLVTIAKDAKLQLEFNPAQAQAYRLIGYENRMLAHQDFNDDKKDAGDIGAGHVVTALYEVVPVGVPFKTEGVDPLKYQKPAGATASSASADLLTLKLRYKEPTGTKSSLIELAVKDQGRSLDDATDDTRFAAGVAAFGMVLRDSEHKGKASLDMALKLAEPAVGEDKGGYRREFLEMVRKAQRLKR